jgi:hypothetical protein
LDKEIDFLCRKSTPASPFRQLAEPVPLPTEASHLIIPLTPNELLRRRAVSPLKIKIPSKNMLEKPTNATIIHSVY